MTIRYHRLAGVDLHCGHGKFHYRYRHTIGRSDILSLGLPQRHKPRALAILDPGKVKTIFGRLSFYLNEAQLVLVVIHKQSCHCYYRP
jgi:hypothetical protein